ncbi:hypothetical protein GCM10025872_30620 [Barrientosiimonas endolithica]|uniref:HTH marR-type domain-containing protein n=1 Tax=Barrientosiimonas endolithica TaxID=1535208 RepID=A0ABM8HEH5_9MICO|nr:hypothetical protein GCM10025872_30620 [Barrientosiimonas endolithica]
MRERPVDDPHGELAGRRGYVDRAPDPEDGRAAILSLTDAGREVLRTVRRSRDAWMISRIEDLTDEELRVLDEAREILTRVAAR